MFKKLLIAVAIALPMSAMAQKFGTVDIESVFQAMPETAAMQTQLAETSKKYEEEFSKLQEEVNKLYSEYQSIANDAATPQSIKDRRMQEIQERMAKVEQFRATAEQDIQRHSQTLMAPIHSKLTDAVKAVGAEGSFTFIFTSIPEMILYQGTDVIDATPLVRAKLGLN